MNVANQQNSKKHSVKPKTKYSLALLIQEINFYLMVAKMQSMSLWDLIKILPKLIKHILKV